MITFIDASQIAALPPRAPDGGAPDADPGVGALRIAANADAQRLHAGTMTGGGATNPEKLLQRLGLCPSLRLTLSAGAAPIPALGVSAPSDGGEAGPIVGLVFDGPEPPRGRRLSIAAASALQRSEIRPALPRFSHVCFTPGTLIRTPGGLTPIDALRPGDLVVTRDRGEERLRWIGHHTICTETLAAIPTLAPVLVSRGALGPGLPARDTLLSPNHRVLLNDWRAERYVGSPEALAPVHALVDGAGIRRQIPAGGLTYIQLVFDRHEILRANGLEAESFHAAGAALESLEPALRAALFRACPHLMFGRCGDPARPVLAESDTRRLLAA